MSAPAPDPTPKPIGYETSTPRAPRGFDDAFDDAGACRKLAYALLSVAADIEGTANIRPQLDALLAEADRLEQIDALLAEIDRLEHLDEAHAHTVHADGTGAPR